MMLGKHFWKSRARRALTQAAHPSRRIVTIAAVGAVAASAGSLFAWQADAFAQDPKGPPPELVRTAPEPIPPEIQQILQQADAPTHSELTPWGLFVINPVIDGQSLINPQGLPVPPLTGPSARRIETAGQDGLDRARTVGLHTVDVPESLRPGLDLIGMYAAGDGEQFVLELAYSSAGDAPGTRKFLHVLAFTPAAPVPFEEFPDNAIWDFSKSMDVNGFPTLMVVPDRLTADQGDERTIAWSQGKAVYYIRTIGLFENEDVIRIAREISRQELTK